MTEQIAIVERNERSERASVSTLPAFGSADAFELLQRQANAISQSGMVPPLYKRWREDGTENLQAMPNCLIALNMSMRLRADPLMTMQNLIIINGNPGWSARFLIGLFNTCGRFSAIRYRFNEQETACRAYCVELATGEEIEGPAASIAMAKAEGWFSRKSSKWPTMPEIMLRNRAASFLIRTTAPELSLGLPMADELADRAVIDNEAPIASPLERVRSVLRGKPIEAADVSLIEPDPVPEEATHGTVTEPEDLPIKDGERESPPEPRPKDAREPKPRASLKRTSEPAVTADTVSTVFSFDVASYAERIDGTRDIDLLTVMHEDLKTAPPDTPGREELMSRIDARARELLSDLEPG